MCGIASIFAYSDSAPRLEMGELRAIRDQMSFRGPDGSGEWRSKNARLALGHRHLSITDLSPLSSQPMLSQDGRLAISYNGEIYNFVELREELEAQGHVFLSHSDTEVLLHLYDEIGEGMFTRLRGMYAFALWDDRKQALLVARDSLGIKPLYYADDGRTFRAASQVKALLASRQVSRTADPAGLVGFLLWGSIPDPYTTYQDIRALPAGSYMWVTADGPRPPQSYFSIAQLFSKRSTEMNSSDDLKNALAETVRSHLISDVKMGLFLSGGIDSGAILSIASKDANLEALTLTFSDLIDTADDESRFARKTADHFGVRHRVRVVSRSELSLGTEKLLEDMDQPSVDGINSYWISRVAREMGWKVALSGLGGDEVFAGYPSYREIPLVVKTLGRFSKFPMAGELWRILFGLTDAITAGVLLPHPKYAGLIRYAASCEDAYFLKRGLFMPWELKHLLPPETIHEGLRRLQLSKGMRAIFPDEPMTTNAKIAALEMSIYMRHQLLRDADWGGMAHSIEVRLPFADTRFLSKIAHLISSKHLSKKDLSDNLKNPLPQQIVNRRKTGFCVPMNTYIFDKKFASDWKRLPILRRHNCPWARRWAYILLQRHLASIASS